MRRAESDPQRRAPLAEGDRAAGEHPPLEDLAAYHDGRLPPGRDADIREHIVQCDACIAIVLELGSLDAEEEPAAEEGELAIAAAWHSVRERLRAESLLAPAERRHTPRPISLLAAALAVVSLGLAGWVFTLKQDLDELAQPQVNPPLVSLAPLGALRDPPAEHPVVELPGRGERIWLILNSSEDVDYSNFRVRCFLPEGRLLWTLDGLHRTPAGNFRIELPARMLPPGDLHLFLSGTRGSEQIPLAEYRLHIVGR